MLSNQLVSFHNVVLQYPVAHHLISLLSFMATNIFEESPASISTYALKMRAAGSSEMFKPTRATFKFLLSWKPQISS
jgi:hypothetical protein